MGLHFSVHNELQFSFTKSSGPGGQNVNKVNSKVILKWDVSTTKAFSEIQKNQLLNKLANKLTTSGLLIITSDRFRDQNRNRSDCIEKLSQIITQALTIQKKRKKTKPSFRSIQKIKTSKAKRSKIKSLRKVNKYDE